MRLPWTATTHGIGPSLGSSGTSREPNTGCSTASSILQRMWWISNGLEEGYVISPNPPSERFWGSCMPLQRGPMVSFFSRAHQTNAFAPHASPPPKAAVTTRSPLLRTPLSTASRRAIGTLAPAVLP